MTTATEYTTQRTADGAVDRMFKTMTAARRSVLAITGITMVASYTHQVHAFLHAGAGWASWILPTPLDLLMLTLMRIGQLDGIPTRNRRYARILLLIPAAASAGINVTGTGTGLVRGVYAGLVVAIALGDYALSLIKADPAAVLAVAVAAETPTVDAELAAKRSAAAKKAAETRAAKKAAATTTKAAATTTKAAATTTKAAPKTPKPRRRPAAAPVSPAPGGRMQGGLWIASTVAEAIA